MIIISNELIFITVDLIEDNTGSYFVIYSGALFYYTS